MTTFINKTTGIITNQGNYKQLNMYAYNEMIGDPT